MSAKPINRQLLGKKGEDIACHYLERKGFRIIDRNFRIRYGEIDIIALDKNVTVFIEVKTRVGDPYGVAEEAVTKKKLAEVTKTAEFYTLEHDKLPGLQRIDVIAIDLDEEGEIIDIRHHENVTG